MLCVTQGSFVRREPRSASAQTPTSLPLQIQHTSFDGKGRQRRINRSTFFSPARIGACTERKISSDRPFRSRKFLRRHRRKKHTCPPWKLYGSLYLRFCLFEEWLRDFRTLGGSHGPSWRGENPAGTNRRQGLRELTSSCPGRQQVLPQAIVSSLYRAAGKHLAWWELVAPMWRACCPGRVARVSG